MSEIRESLINSLNEFNESIINLDKNQIKYLIENEKEIVIKLNEFVSNNNSIIKKESKEYGDYVSNTTNQKYDNETGFVIHGLVESTHNGLGGFHIIFFFKVLKHIVNETSFWGKDLGKKYIFGRNELKIYFFPKFEHHKDGNISIHDVEGFTYGLRSPRDGKLLREGWSTKYLIKHLEEDKVFINDNEMSFVNEILSFLITKINESSKFSSEIKSDLNIKQNSFITEFDKDGNGELDTIQINDDFVKIVKKHQSKIVDIDKNYVQQFVKISNYQKQKRTNLQSIFEYLSKTENEDELGIYVEHLKEQVHSYELIILHSLNMVTSLINDDMFTFYEIHESFDKLGMFNSNHENEVSQSLKNIDVGISDLMNSINKMERNIVSELNNLSYITQESFSELSNSVSKQLSSINSSIKFNNLLTGIQTYQMYKVNKNTKSLRG